MRKFLVVLLLSPLLVAGQSPESVAAFQRSIPGSLGKPVRLPDPGYNPDFSLEYIADYYLKQRVFIVSADSVYRKIFYRYHYTQDSLRKHAADKGSWSYQWMVEHLSDSLPRIDFARQELVVYAACGQCLAFCKHGEHESCHRNACNFIYEWFLRDKMIVVEKETGPKRNFLDALYGYPPDPAARPVNLPSLWHSNLREVFEIDRQSSYLFVVQNDSLYHAIFDGYYHFATEPMPVIDFSKQELLVRIACHQCLAYCNSGKNWDNSPCHRDACRYNDTWYVRDKGSGRDQLPEQ